MSCLLWPILLEGQSGRRSVISVRSGGTNNSNNHGGSFPRTKFDSWKDHLISTILFMLIFAISDTNSSITLAAFPLSPTPQYLDSYPSNSIELPPSRILYANGVTESTLPVCSSMSVCNKVDNYDKPWMEKQCKCPSHFAPCSNSLTPNDGHTIIDKTRHYKLCEPVRKLDKCRYFRDITWTLVTKGDNLTEHLVHCQCPRDAVAYMIKRQPYRSAEGDHLGFKYSFACSPQSRLLCQRKEPCRLFTLRRRSNVTDVNTTSLCQCPRGHSCPSHHSDAGVIPGKLYTENMLRTFSGYCLE